MSVFQIEVTNESDLEDRRKRAIARAKRHSAHEQLFIVLNYVVGYPQVILSAIVTALSTSAGTKKYDALFFLSLSTTILAFSIVFFKFNDKARSHHSVSSQWSELAADIKVGFIEKEFDVLEKVTFEKEKFIHSQEPPFCTSACLHNID